jgi:predicted transposase YbfD/YdcC
MHSQSGQKAKGIPALHLLNAWSVKNDISLAQMAVDAKTNEITAVPAILDILDDRGSTFFLCSFPPNAERLAEAVRGHWGVENGLHWVLDVVYKEDASKKRTDHAPKNFLLIRKMALNLLKLDNTKGRTGPMKPMKAAFNRGTPGWI